MRATLGVFLGIDPALLRQCPTAERAQAYLCGLIAAANCGVLGSAVAVLLLRMAEHGATAAVVGIAIAAWFSTIQRLIITLHNATRRSWRGVVSRLFCGGFLGLFGVAAAYALGAGQPTEAAALGRYCIAASMFLIPFLATGRLIGRGTYGEKLRAREAALLAAWRGHFRNHYESLVRELYGLAKYSMPAGMVQGE